MANSGMTILEMINDVAACVGDPLMKKVLPATILRWVRQGSHSIQNALYPVMPEFFTESYTGDGDGGSVTWDLPDDYKSFISARMQDAAGVWYEAVRVPRRNVNAIGKSVFYPDDDYTRPLVVVEEKTITWYPAPVNNLSWELVYEKKRDVDFDVGTCNVTGSGSISTFSDFTPVKSWVADYWIGGEIILNDVEYAITDNSALSVTIGSVVNDTGTEIEIYLPSLVPSEHHDLIVMWAMVRALRYLERGEEALVAERGYAENLMKVIGE